ncbi:MAG TPA: hypothetical protein VMF66_17485 [Candidatus Acidoferrum sp.]|nr:hypothetical protein [Candidatus Acidoferrum sp.]
MNGRIKVAQWLVGLGCLVLFVGAGLHLAAGYPRISKVLAVTPLDAGFRGALRAVFLVLGWEWIVLGVIVLIAAFTETRIRKTVVLIGGLAMLVDAVVMAKLIGWFVGTDMILVSGLLVFAGGLAFASSRARVEEPAMSSRTA